MNFDDSMLNARPDGRRSPGDHPAEGKALGRLAYIPQTCTTKDKNAGKNVKLRGKRMDKAPYWSCMSWCLSSLQRTDWAA